MVLSKVRSSFFRLNSEFVLALPERFVQRSKHIPVLSGTRLRALQSPARSARPILSLSLDHVRAVSGTNIAAVGLAFLGFGAYQWIGKEAQALDVDESYLSPFPAKPTDIRRMTPWRPLSMEDVEFYLRANEKIILPPGTKSDILRMDYVQVRSNLPPEDLISPFATFGAEEGNGWLAFGIYDGHS